MRPLTVVVIVRSPPYLPMMSAAGSNAVPPEGALEELIFVCSSLPGIYEISHGTAAFDEDHIACGVTIANDQLLKRFTATGATTADAAAAVLWQIRAELRL